MSEIKFKRDTAFRKGFFTPESFAHPAKMDAQLLIWIVEKYTDVGETIVDPMAGQGTMMLACTLGRDVVLIELEDKFCKMMRANWGKVKQRPQLGYEMGKCQIIQGDARQLKGLLVDKIVTSPPYERVAHWGKLREEIWLNGAHYPTQPSRMGVEAGAGDNLDNIGNLPYGEIDNIITSPPYEESMGDKHHSPRADKLAREKSNPTTYTDKVDSIITSPPYEESVHSTGQSRESLEAKGIKASIGSQIFSMEEGYSKSADNIGNLKSQSYLEAMLQVYQQCYKVLKENCLMVLVTKNFIRNKQVVRLDTDTIKLCEQAGFKFLERHYRKLPAQSFWRIIYHKKFPDVEQINYEDVLIFSKVKI